MNQNLNRIDIFLHIYFYELEIKLKANQHIFNGINFNLAEANIDLPLKFCLKNFIVNHFTTIPSENLNHRLIIQEIENQKIEIFNYSEYMTIKIVDILIPNVDHIEDYKAITLQEDKRYRDPDLIFLISDESNLRYEKVELKSTKKDVIPGSSIQQIDPLEWMIFFKHQDLVFDISIGKAVNSLNSKVPFPDRSPRPQVSFSDLAQWNRNHRIFQNQELRYIQEKNDQKIEKLVNWQNDLANEWLNSLIKRQSNKKETWFNQTIKIFVFKVLVFYENLTEQEKKSFWEQLKDHQSKDHE
jgi:hypothetical protein